MKVRLTVALLALAACFASARARACERPKADRLVSIRFFDSVPLEKVVAHAAQSSCVDYRFDPALGRRMLVGPLQIEVMGADLDATYAILFHTMNLGVEGRGPTRKLVATGPEPEASKAVIRLEQEITRIDDRHSSITRRGALAAVGGSGLGRETRIVPEIRNGKSIGFRLYSMKSGMPLDLVGFRNGDVVLSVNGIELATPDKLLEAYTKLRTANNLRFGLERNGAPFVLDVKIIPGPDDAAALPPPAPRSTFTRAELEGAFHSIKLRLIPSSSAGNADGVRLFSLSRTGPVLEAAGFLNADLVRGINGRPVTTPESFVQEFDAAVKTNRIEFSLLRIGRPKTLVVDVK